MTMDLRRVVGKVGKWASMVRRSFIRKQLRRRMRPSHPDDAEVQWSRRVIAAHEEAENAGKGVVLLDGQLIENLHVEEAHRIVGLTDRIAEMSGQDGFAREQACHRGFNESAHITHCAAALEAAG